MAWQEWRREGSAEYDDTSISVFLLKNLKPAILRYISFVGFVRCIYFSEKDIKLKVKSRLNLINKLHGSSYF